MANHDDRFSAFVALEEGLNESSVAIRDPAGLLGVVGLEHVVSLHLHGDDQVGHRVWIRLTGLAQLDVAWHPGWWELLSLLM